MSDSHCTAAAANIIRYNQLYNGLQYKDSTMGASNPTAYNRLTREMGYKMKTGTKISGTVDTDVIPGIIDFVNTFVTNKSFVGKMYSGLEWTTWATYRSIIDQDVPVLLTLGYEPQM